MGGALALTILQAANWMPKVDRHDMVLVSLVADHKMRRADPDKSMPKIEVDRPAIFDADLQPGAFESRAPAVIQGVM
jgi:hypothetical protein